MFRDLNGGQPGGARRRLAPISAFSSQTTAGLRAPPRGLGSHPTVRSCRKMLWDPGMEPGSLPLPVLAPPPSLLPVPVPCPRHVTTTAGVCVCRFSDSLVLAGAFSRETDHGRHTQMPPPGALRLRGRT